jgi:hypothetical protein
MAKELLENDQDARRVGYSALRCRVSHSHNSIVSHLCGERVQFAKLPDVSYISDVPGRDEKSPFPPTGNPVYNIAEV